MAESKRQHYVPQLYLRLFSNDKKTIKVFSIKENKIVSEKASIARQCYKNYFYGTNLAIDKMITKLETATKPIINSILEYRTKPSKKTKEYYRLLIFVLYQSARTLFAADQLSEGIDKLAKIFLKKEIELNKPNGIKVDDVDNVTIKIDKPAIQNLQGVTQVFPLLFDLNCKIVFNSTKIEFITSDNPVILYNKYYLKDYLNYAGFACKGLIIIFPLSPKVSLIFYDSNMYNIGGKKLHTTINCYNEQDVNEINILQYLNADKVIFTKSMKVKYLKLIITKAHKYKAQKKSIVKEQKAIIKDMGEQSIIRYTRPKCKYEINISFLKIRKKISSKYLSQKIYRDPYLVSLHKEFLKKVDEKKYKHSEWYVFLRDKIGEKR